MKDTFLYTHSSLHHLVYNVRVHYYIRLLYECPRATLSPGECAGDKSGRIYMLIDLDFSWVVPAPRAPAPQTVQFHLISSFYPLTPMLCIQHSGLHSDNVYDCQTVSVLFLSGDLRRARVVEEGVWGWVGRGKGWIRSGNFSAITLTLCRGLELWRFRDATAVVIILLIINMLIAHLLSIYFLPCLHFSKAYPEISIFQ